MIERGGDFPRRRLQKFRLLAQPDRFDDVSGDTCGKSSGNGFNFREFWHASSVYSADKEKGGRKKGRAYTAENAEIAEIFLFLGFSVDSACSAVKELG